MVSRKAELAVQVLRSGGLTPLICKVNGVGLISRYSRFNPVLSGWKVEWELELVCL